MQQPKAFTVDHLEIATSLQTQCGVCPGITVEALAAGAKHPEVRTVTAIWDTGAEVSSISTRVASEMGLITLGKARNSTAAGFVDVDIFAINILLPNGVNFAMVPVTGNDLGDVDMLIGMDIISRGDFSVTNVGEKTTFSFRIPSMERIDYVTQTHQQPIAKSKEPGRNDLCPCGSGKKYKNCHGKS